VPVTESLRALFRLPRHLVALFVLVTLFAALLLLAFGWRLLQQEVKLEEARREAGRVVAADLLATRLEQALSATEEVLRDPEAMRLAAVTPDSVTLVIGETQFEVLPHGRLLFYPAPSAATAAPDETFAEGEAIEYQRNDPRLAAAWFQRLARGAPVEVKAGALVRAARNLRKSGRPDAALELYSEAAQLKTTAIDGVPTELFARFGRCSLLADLRRTSALRAEAFELRELLLEGRWRVTRAVFEVYLESASNWAGAGEPPANYLIALSEAVHSVWLAHAKAPPGSEPADRWVGHRTIIAAGGFQFTVLSQRFGSRTHILIAGAAYVEDQWKSRIASLEARHRVQSTLQAPGQRGSADAIRRAASETGLPWTLVVRDASPREGARKFAAGR
jgi:tetratricopeptide (TPR) repeat protein